jgi:B-cell receptor-associated protein 31
MYLCGFTLFLSLILNRTYSLILDVLRLEEKVAKYGAKQGNATAGGAVTGGDATLRKELEKKTKDLEAMKAQAEGLAREYNELSDRYEAVQQKETVPRKRL